MLTIDEAIKFISERKILDCPVSCEHCMNFGCIVNKIITMLEELKWYKEQNIEELIDEIESTTWYHINKNGELVEGANGEDDVPLYKANEILTILDKYRYDDGE